MNGPADKNRPTFWRYASGEPIPLWHAVHHLAAHFEFGYRDQLLGRAREIVNGNPDYARAQEAGREAARREEARIRELGQAYAVKAFEELERAHELEAATKKGET